MRASATTALAMFALLALSPGVLAQDPVTHWRNVAGRAAVHHVDNAHDAVGDLEVPALDPGALVAEAEATLQALAELDPQAVLDGLPVQDLLDTLPPLPGLPALDGAAAFAVRVVQYQAGNAVRLFEHLRP